MNSKRIKEGIKKMFPCKWDGNFIISLDSLFKDYLSLLSEEECQSDIIKEIDIICRTIVDSVSLIFEGCHGEAYGVFSRLMNDSVDNILSTGLFSLPNCIQVHEGGHWYRARESDCKELSVLDLFHYPLDKRGKVSSQRYSCPGFPCLYLSSSTYGCWEELGRPDFDALFFSSYRVRNAFRVLDLRIPDVDNYDEIQLSRTLKLLPLIIACSFCVNNTEDVFKPEYIIPQLLMETIISNNHKKIKDNKTYLDEDIIWGIMYTSIHISKDFNFGSKYLQNIVMPIIDTRNKSNYCSYLASSFDISTPMCFEYESMKRSVYRRYLCSGSSSASYQETKMGYMESIMRNAEYKTLPHLVVFVPKDGIVLNPSGDPVNINIRSSGDFQVE